MGLIELIDALETDAEQELDRRRVAVLAEAAQIRTAASAAAAAIVERAVGDARAAATARGERELLALNARSAAALRRAREDALDAVLADTRAELYRVRSRPDYPSILGACLREALEALPTAQHVHVDPRDTEIAHDLLARSGHAARCVPDLSCAGGAVVANDGRRVDNTLESRLAAAWPRLRSTLAAAWADGSGT
ncbi:hypothetical protein TUM20983_37100 [Mycobacterium antarcticum]|uniref:V-type ATP synthase subunit E n=1 Tax=Mycolicibacterium sp. TUM20983 TaxID=3023369 RepID=UPI0023A529CC|nr:V-type ATP synthase subunit E [Mycolicibacterium sp. TUM20983]GLP76600.1 hypothetical protein TUM20983_37100 [Mycolicibacterium sp. TUM20983]